MPRPNASIKVSSNVEGEAEVLIKRGALLDGAGEFKQARASLEGGLAKAQAIKNAFQIVRAQMYLSSVTASEGQCRAIPNAWRRRP